MRNINQFCQGSQTYPALLQYSTVYGSLTHAARSTWAQHAFSNSSEGLCIQSGFPTRLEDKVPYWTHVQPACWTRDLRCAKHLPVNVRSACWTRDLRCECQVRVRIPQLLRFLTRHGCTHTCIHVCDKACACKHTNTNPSWVPHSNKLVLLFRFCPGILWSATVAPQSESVELSNRNAAPIGINSGIASMWQPSSSFGLT